MDEFIAGDDVEVVAPDWEYGAITPVIQDFMGTVVDVNVLDGTVDVEDQEGTVFDGIPVRCVARDES